jgi:zinc protease
MTRGPSLSRAALALVALVALLAPAAQAAEPTRGPQKITAIEGITEYRLDNGLKVLLFPDPSTAKVTVNLTVFVGSRQEGYGETGMAHLLEHMLFKGTPTHRKIPKALRDRGASFNGTTWVDRTNYFETLPASDDNLEFAIRLEADRLVNSLIRREDLASEMTVVRSEFERGENDPVGILSQRMMSVSYEWHNYGKSTIGNRSDIERVPVENLRVFYKKHYQPDNAMVVVAGNFKPEKALALITKYFGALPRPKRALDSTYTEEPAQDGERIVTLRRVGKIGVVGAVYHIPSAAHPDYPALEVLANLLDTEPSGRLYKALVPTKKATSVSATAFAWHDPGVVEILCKVDRNNDLGSVRDAMLEVVEGLHAAKLDPQEVERVKRKLLKNRELLMSRSNRIGVLLSEWAARGDWRLFFLHRDRLEKVTPADVTRVAGKYLARNNRTVGLYIPSDKAERSPVPATPDLAKLLKGYKGRGDAVAQGESFDPTPENIEKRTRRSTLLSGVKVALLPRKTRGNVVTAELILRYGNADSLKDHTTAADFLAEMMARGTKKHTRQELTDELDKLKARLGAYGTAGQVTFSITCKRDALPKVIELLGEILRQPSFPAEEFDVLRREQRDSLEQNRTEPTALAATLLRRKLSPYPKGHIHYVPTMEEEIARLENLTVDEVKALYEKQLGGEHGEFVVVGDFDREQTLKTIGKALAGWKAKTPYRRIARPAAEGVKAGQEVIETPDKANAFYIAGLTLPLKDSSPDYAALKIGSFLFGEGSLASRLGDRLRQKEGLCYTVRSGFSADAQDPYGRFMMYAICNPINMGKVDKGMLEELAKVRTSGVTTKELEEAKVAYLRTLKNSRSSDRALVSLLQEGLEVGRDMSYHAELEKRVQALTPGDVQGAFRKYLAPKKLVIIHAGDFKKKAEGK